MKTIGAGFTILIFIMELIPTGWIGYLLEVYGYDRILYSWGIVLSIITGLFIASIIVWVFLKKTQLASRLTLENVLGRRWLLAGIVLAVTYLTVLSLASFAEAGGPVYVVKLYSEFFLLPAKALLIIGAVKVFFLHHQLVIIRLI